MSDAGYYPQIPAAPPAWSKLWGERAAYAIKLLIGKANCTTDLTLSPLATSTVMIDARLHPGCVLAFMPTTAAAATAKPSICVDPIGKGVATVHHASAAAVDQAFRVAILG